MYYDNHDNPYKIEEKYSNNHLVTYLAHFNDGSICVKRKTFFSGDTAIVREESYEVWNKPTWPERFRACHYWMIIQHERGIGDSIGAVEFVGYKLADNTDSMIFVADTLLAGEAALNCMDLPNRINKISIQSILDCSITINTDSLILQETVFAYFLNGIPIKIKMYDSNNMKYRITKGFVSTNKVIYRSYTMQDDAKLSEVDTIAWNKDTTSIQWSSINYSINDSWKGSYQIAGDTLRMLFGDSIREQIVYLNGRNIFQNMLIGNLIYNDVLYNVDLRHFDREKIVSSTSQGQTEHNEYAFDGQNRIIEQRSYNGKQLEKRVTYEYKKEE